MRRDVVVVGACALLVLMGAVIALCASTTKANDACVVVVIAHEAPVGENQTMIATPVERALKQIDGVRAVGTSVDEKHVELRTSFVPAMTDDVALESVRTAVTSIQRTLPAGTSPPTISRCSH